MNIALQVFIFVSAAAAIWLVNDRRQQHRRAGCWIGLVSQPAWIWSSIAAQQWGVLLLALWYAFSYARGLRAS